MAQNLPEQQGGMVDELIPDEEGVEYTNVTELEEQATPADTKIEVKDEPVVDDMPEELKGKSTAEIARMYKEAHGLIGRQGTELGELRKLADKAIQTTLAATQGRQRQAPAPVETPKQPDDVDFFADPKKAMETMIAQHPELKRLQGQNQKFAAMEIQRRKNDNKAVFNSEFPDVDQILADPGFREWVGKSKVRQALLKRADAAYDLDAAREVLGTWKELVGARAPARDAAAETVAAGRAANRKAARVPTGGNASQSEGAGAKIFRRSEILKMMTHEPAKYEKLADEIARAYAENRVR